MAWVAAFALSLEWPALAQTKTSVGPDVEQWQTLNAQIVAASNAGDYAKGTPLAEQALELAREKLGTRDPQTLTSLNNLAFLYKAQGRHGEAELLLREALQGGLGSLNNLALLYQAEGRYGEAEPLYREALQAGREVLGPRHPDTLTSLNNLATLYEAQGRYGEAEPLYQEALQASREVLGPRHPQTLASLNNLASLYDSQGRYGEAKPLFQEALQARREVLGPRHPDTLISLNNLAALYDSQGRYGEAEPLHQEALQTNREVLGPRNPDTLISLNNLASLYNSQGRYGEAEPLLREALQARREVLGARHPDTLGSLTILAGLYTSQGRYGEAEPLYREALQASRELLGLRHPQTLTGLNKLGGLYYSQGRYGEAEPLYQEALQARREVLGPRHPDTLTTLNDLAFLYNVQGRYGEAEPLFREALQVNREVLGPRHPQTLTTQLNTTGLLVNMGRRAEAVRMLGRMEPHLLGWMGQELYSTAAGAVRRQLVSSQATFQDAVLSLAMTESGSEARRLAGTVMLRFKLLQGEEEAYLARLARRSQDPRVQMLADEVGKLRTALADATRAEPDAFDKTLQVLEASQQALGTVSRDYKDHLRVQTANLDDVRAALPTGTVLIEFRQFRQADFRTAKVGELRFAALLLSGFDDPMVVDLGAVSALGLTGTGFDDAAAAVLYQQLFGSLEDKLAAATTVYVAPDGVLNLVPFARLKLADGRYFGERQEVRLLQSGRDLLRPDPDRPARGLLALGGIDFGAAAIAEAKADSLFLASATDHAGAITRASGTLRDGFAQLAASGEEADQVTQWYRRLRKDEPAEVWSGATASKVRLLALQSPPRVLHLATHGFYLPGESREPMLLSGIALAGANRELAGAGADGILFALEAQGLNLEGTELVVLSACDTAQGSLDYSEGVLGLARALRTAGARNVLVTLWKLNDGEARDFMVEFYKTWLTQVRSDPAKALRDTQLSWLKQDTRRDPRVWAPYILIE
jgi:CHAT domain-containing protein/tetratricopeptide (TPR) repeat protein